jgi:sigma-B regulation protein RsbU (phosphoserine phosphatase)
MKYRWKLLILFLLISIIPIVSLRMVGIHSVRSMAGELMALTRQRQMDEARQQLQQVVDNAARAIQNRREAAGRLVSTQRLLEQAFQWYDAPAGTRAYLCAIATNISAGGKGVKILASLHSSKDHPGGWVPADEAHWLGSADKEQSRAMRADMVLRQSGIREMPFDGRICFWAYTPVTLQGSALVAIVPRDRLVNGQNRLFLQSIQWHLSKVDRYTAAFLIFLIGIVSVVALAFSRTVTKPLAQLAAASQKLSRGDFNAQVTITSRDEFGHMGRIFNQVGPQLEERYGMLRALEIAEEIQGNLFPRQPPQIPGLDIYGMTLFSEKTGGDYFDYLCADEADPAKLCVTVGDVAGHGVPAALLMATVRGLLRLRATMPGTLGEIVGDINREFAKDVDASGQFMTLLLTRVNLRQKQMTWVRAGHDPGILYDPHKATFIRLHEEHGLPLGVDRDAVYRAASRSIRPGQIIFLGTDGIWETRAADGRQFGKRRLQQVIQANAEASAQSITLSILDAVAEFRGDEHQEDDITVVIIKVTDIPEDQTAVTAPSEIGR